MGHGIRFVIGTGDVEGSSHLLAHEIDYGCGFVICRLGHGHYERGVDRIDPFEHVDIRGSKSNERIKTDERHEIIDHDALWTGSFDVRNDVRKRRGELIVSDRRCVEARKLLDIGTPPGLQIDPECVRPANYVGGSVRREIQAPFVVPSVSREQIRQ